MVFKLQRRKLNLKEGLIQKTKKVFKPTEQEKASFKKAKKKLGIVPKKFKKLGKKVDFRRLF